MPEHRNLALDPALLDAPPTTRIVSVVPPFPEPRILAGRHQAVRPWCLLTQDTAPLERSVPMADKEPRQLLPAARFRVKLAEKTAP